MTKSDALMKIRQQEANTYEKFGGQKATYDRMELERLKQLGGLAKLSEDQLAKMANSVYERVSGLAADPEDPEVKQFKGKSPVAIMKALREELGGGGGGGGGGDGGATSVPPPHERVVGQTYPTPRGWLKWNGSGWVAP